MTPLDFIRSAPEHYDDPLKVYKESFDKPIVVFGPDGEYEILSYYMMENGAMCLDIQKVE